MRRCDVLVKNKTIPQSKSFAVEYFFKNSIQAIGKTFHVIRGARSLHYRFYRFNLV